MARKKGLHDYTERDLIEELARRRADREFRDGMTMSDMELAAEKLKADAGEPALASMLARIKPERPTPKACPRCGKRTPVKARDRERTVRSLSGPITFTRNYHYCEPCKHGFYPVDRLLDLPEQGELTGEMEKRVIDFAINDVYGEAVARWSVHYAQPISDNLLRRVVARVGEQCQAVDQGLLQECLKPRPTVAAEVLVVETDGSMLPIRGDEPWKEAKVGVVYRHDVVDRAPISETARYVTVLGGIGEFAPVLEEALEVERIDECGAVVWLGDGAASNWRLADQLAADATQILDWYHAVEHAMDCGKVLLGDDSPWLPVWQQRCEQLLADGNPDALLAQLAACASELARRRDKPAAQAALDNLVRYYTNNAERMEYAYYRARGFPIGSGAVESAHRHVLQARMKRAGQRWALRCARRMARLRAAYRTAGATRFHAAIRHASRDAHLPRERGRKQTFRYARYGRRDLDACALIASN
jgi:hypothetical protein